MKRFSRHPYTEEEIAEAECCRCGSPAKFQWNACADGVYRPVCPECDVALNALALEFMRVPGWKRKMRKYVKYVKGC